jgi:hypothetical protein
VETFEKRLGMPTGYYLFYDYFLRSAVGEEEWKRLAKTVPTDTGMSSELNEAFALVLLKNNYFAWLLEAKQDKPDLVTDYDHGDTMTDRKTLVEFVLGDVFFCLDEDMKDQSYLLFPIVGDDDDDDDSTTDTSSGADKEEAYKYLKKQYLQQVERLRESVKDSDEYKHMLCSVAKINIYEENLDEKGRKRKKRKIMKELKIYTIPQGGEKAFRGWSVRAYTEMAKHKKAIAMQSVLYDRFNKAYRSLYRVQNQRASRNERVASALVSDVDYNELFDFPIATV